MPSKKSSSSQKTSLSVETSGTPNSGKSMDAIAKAVTQSDSRIAAWENASNTDDPFVVGHYGGQHVGQRVWNLNEQLFNFDRKFNSKSTNQAH